MPLSIAQNSHDFVFALLHGKWANAVRGEALSRLLNSGTVENLLPQLQALGLDISRREAFHQDLAAQHVRKLADIAAMLDAPAAQYYHAIAQLTYFENLKTLLAARFLDDRHEDISVLIVQAPTLPQLNARAALAEQTTAEQTK